MDFDFGGSINAMPISVPWVPTPGGLSEDAGGGGFRAGRGLIGLVGGVDRLENDLPRRDWSWTPAARLADRR